MNDEERIAFEKNKLFKDEFVDLPLDEIVHYKYEYSRKSSVRYKTEHLFRDGWLLNFHDPYTNDEIQEFEEKLGYELPHQLRVYLTEISKSLYKTHLGCMNIELTYCDELSKPFTKFDGKLKENKDREVYIESEHSHNHYYGTLKIRDHGYGPTDRIVLNGPDKGIIMRENMAFPRLFIGSGRMWKICDNFFEYASKNKLSYDADPKITVYNNDGRIY
jgi:hypothetical protein